MIAPGAPPALMRSTMWRATAWPQRKAPLRLTRSTRSKSAGSRSRKSALTRIAGIVDQHVDVAEGVEGRGDHVPHVEPLADVALDVADLAEHAELGGRLRPRLVVEIGDHHPRPLFEETAGDRVADALGAAGDDRDLVVEKHARTSMRQAGSAGRAIVARLPRQCRKAYHLSRDIPPHPARPR